MALVFFQKHPATISQDAKTVDIDETNATCKACAPLLDIASFVWSNKGWVLKGVKKNWDAAGEGWGRRGKLAVVAYKKTPALRTILTYEGQGMAQQITTYYDPVNFRAVGSSQNTFK